MPPTTDTPLVALGVMSSAGTSGQATAMQYVERRNKVRSQHRAFAHVLATHVVEVRFLLGVAPNSSSADAALALAKLNEEAELHKDILRLPMADSRFSCARKPLLWYAHCAKAFPSARYYAVADDDSYVHIERLALDLRSLITNGAAASEDYVLWGFIMWYGVYNNITMVTHEAWGGWQTIDRGARRQRQHLGLCRTDPSRRVCKKLAGWAKETLQSGGLSDVPPWPVANGPLFAVSRALGRVLVEDSIPANYLEALHQTPRVRKALARVGGPRKSNYGCWPVYDSVFGFWIARVAEARGFVVRLVNTPGMVQHHPWPATVKGAFARTSIVMHGLKTSKPKTIAVLANIEQHVRRNESFIPFRRKCGRCDEMGWSSWPGSAHAKWQCCGCDYKAESVKECEARMGQRPN